MKDLVECDEVNWIENRPSPKGHDNADAAEMSNVDNLQNDTPYLLKGAGMSVGVWDEGEIQKFHPDLSTRVTIKDAGSVNSHATHVAGTIAGNGSGNANAKGMAPLSSIYSYDYNGDVPQEIISAPVALSNHSWGSITGWEYNYYDDGYWVWFGDQYFGYYSYTARTWDEKVYGVDDPILGGLILVKSSGNDRSDDGVGSGTKHRHAGDTTNFYYDTHPPDPDYGSIPHKGCAKNVITVGAVTDTGGMTAFSSWGPCDDGRIKPDIVANGDTLTSTCPTDTYCTKSGTSMASPVVTGALALIMQHYAQVDSSYYPKVTSYELKALLINTAVDKGNAGPDYQYGWGLLDAKAAVDLVNQSRDHIRYGVLSDGESTAYQLTVPAGTPVLKVTAAWTDQPGSTVAAKALVNDLDLELVDPSSGIHRPWVLDKANPSSAATRAINTLDNVEQVLVTSPQQGTWTVRMKGSDVQSGQAFAVVSNLEFPCGKIYYFDADGDGYGDSNAEDTIEACTQPAGYASSQNDCDDGDAGVHPGASEKCNGADDDCNPSTGDGIGETW